MRQTLGYVAAVFVVTATTLLSWFLFGEMHLTDVVMVFLLGVVLVSMRFGYGPSIVTAVLSVLAFEFFFIPPLFSFAVSDLRHVVTFAVMFVVAFVISHLTKRIRDQADAVRARARNIASLYEASREIGLAYSREALLVFSKRHGREMFGADVAVVLEGREGGDAPASPGVTLVPLKGSRGPMGALTLVRDVDAPPLDIEERALFEAFAALVGSALEAPPCWPTRRAAPPFAWRPSSSATRFLSSVSHDLLTSRSRSSLGLHEHAPRAASARISAKYRLLPQDGARRGSLRPNRLVRNLLDMTRLDAGSLGVRKEPLRLEEGRRLRAQPAGRSTARARSGNQHSGRTCRLTPVRRGFDRTSALSNLLENAAKYTPFRERPST